MQTISKKGLSALNKSYRELKLLADVNEFLLSRGAGTALPQNQAGRDELTTLAQDFFERALTIVAPEGGK